ncbi:zincin-like metallopeptidase domain-containing protein [Variovorax sp. NFACC27]|uniref:zincin-like metallopeptidase domain-containing protein n=1 Tax=unclassified Variovorax TaxID=663243 RepID=UPI00115FFE1E|nr:antirestriction protein ArdC [Variovorax paradoxus]
MERALRLVAGCDAAIRHGFDWVGHVPEPDEIRLPMPQRFASREHYGATLLHALVCWTGHPRRLHRAFGGRWGDAAFAIEALVAELGTVLLQEHCGLVGAAVEGRASSLAVWLALLRHDRSAIFTAMRAAGQAVDFILAREVPALPPCGGP